MALDQAATESILAKPFVPSRPILLLVEGKDDAAFFEVLRVARGIPPIEIKDYEGKTKLRPFLKGLVAGPGFSQVTALGIARDANGDAAGAVASVRDAIAAAGLATPPAALTTVGAGPTVTFMIVPDDASTGALEELCLRGLSDDPGLPCVSAFFDCLTASGLQHESDGKARVHVMLATRPHRYGLEQALRHNFIAMDHGAFHQAAHFLDLITM